MTTYLVFAKKIGFAISRFECIAIGQIGIVNRKYKFTDVNLYPKVYIANEMLREKANLAMIKTQKNNLVASSVNATIYYHSEILTETNPSAVSSNSGKQLQNT